MTCRLLVLGVGVALVLVGVGGVGHSPRPLGALRATFVERVALSSVIVAGTRIIAVSVTPVTVVGVGVALTISPRAGNALPTTSTFATTISTLSRHLELLNSLKKCIQAV